MPVKAPAKMKIRLYLTKCCSPFIFYFLFIGFTNCKKDFQERSVATLSNAYVSGISGKPNIILFIANDFGFEIPTFNGGE